MTGGTAGLGYDGALAFAREGASVVIAGRRAAQGEAAASSIRKAGGEAYDPYHQVPERSLGPGTGNQSDGRVSVHEVAFD